MKPIHHHGRFVQENPDDKTAALALVDHVQEENDDDRRYALRAVARIRRNARANRDHNRALALLHDQSESREDLLTQILGAAMLDSFTRYTIHLVNGSRPPSAVVSDWHGDGDHFAYYVVTVGVRWVIRTARIVEMVRGATVTLIGHAPEDGKAE